MPPALRRILTWAALCPVVAIAAWQCGGSGRAEQGVRDHGRLVRGRVLDKPGSDHNYVVYEYHTGSATLTGKDWTRDPNPRYDDLQIGDSVWVSYDTTSPETSRLGAPEAALSEVERGRRAFTILATIALPLFIVGVLVWRGRL